MKRLLRENNRGITTAVVLILSVTLTFSMGLGYTPQQASDYVILPSKDYESGEEVSHYTLSQSDFRSSKTVYVVKKDYVLTEDVRCLSQQSLAGLLFEGMAKILPATNGQKPSVFFDHTRFDEDSEFGFVEDTYMREYDEFICDDLGKEWADHIGIADGRVSFFLSKYHNSTFSATSFQDVVGQALKNIGNMKPDPEVLDGRHDDLDKTYNNGNANTQIHRLRKGASVATAINHWKAAMLNPNMRRDIYLVINFIARDHLVENLNRMQAGEQFGERKQTVQILWLVSSLISICHEQGIGIHIVCKKKDAEEEE